MPTDLEKPAERKRKAAQAQIDTTVLLVFAGLALVVILLWLIWY
jgi:hypothetical protein